MNDGDRMRRAGPRLRRTTVLLLLALRAGQRPVLTEGGLHRPGRVDARSGRAAPTDGLVPSEGGAGFRPTAGPYPAPDRRRRPYPCLKVSPPSTSPAPIASPLAAP